MGACRERLQAMMTDPSIISDNDEVSHVQKTLNAVVAVCFRLFLALLAASFVDSLIRDLMRTVSYSRVATLIHCYRQFVDGLLKYYI